MLANFELNTFVFKYNYWMMTTKIFHFYCNRLVYGMNYLLPGQKYTNNRSLGSGRLVEIAYLRVIGVCYWYELLKIITFIAFTTTDQFNAVLDDNIGIGSSQYHPWRFNSDWSYNETSWIIILHRTILNSIDAMNRRVSEEEIDFIGWLTLRSLSVKWGQPKAVI